MKPRRRDPFSRLIRLLAEQAVRGYLGQKPQQPRGFEEKCSNRVVQKDKKTA
jgi:hypothetical protein